MSEEICLANFPPVAYDVDILNVYIGDLVAVVLREKAYQTIKERIVSGQYRPGQPLNEKEITQELQISRTPFREAINALNEENLVQIFPNRGIFVRELTLRDVADGFEIRCLLEPYVVQLACKRISKEDLEELIRRNESLSREDYQGMKGEDEYLHEALLRYVDNRQLVRIMKNLYEYNRFQNAYYDVGSSESVYSQRLESLVECIHEHTLILQRMYQGDSQGAAEIAREHVVNARRRAGCIML